MTAIKHITIVGMGALGILYGDHFIRTLGNDAVTFLADQERIRRYQEETVTCNGKICEFQFQAAGETGAPAQLLIFAVKATALEDAIELARPYVDQNTIIVSVLNGISSEQIIRQKLGTGTLIYSVAQGMDAVKCGNKLTYSHMGKLCIGLPARDQDRLPMLSRLEQLFSRTGLPYVVEPDILHRLWSKWMLNVGVNQVVMVAEGTYRTVQHPGAPREQMLAAMREVIMLARQEGIAVTERDLEEYVALVDTLNPDGMPSMRQDGLARRYSEVELFAGTVIQKARAGQMAVPVNEYLYHKIAEIENSYR
ncbi:MAG: ketopantoate reductase family protein [Lachnospiraceae bacterium]